MAPWCCEVPSCFASLLQHLLIVQSRFPTHHGVLRKVFATVRKAFAAPGTLRWCRLGPETAVTYLNRLEQG